MLIVAIAEIMIHPLIKLRYDVNNVKLEQNLELNELWFNSIYNDPEIISAVQR